MLQYLREDEKQSAELFEEKDISEKQIYALQYMADYIFHKLSKKNKNDSKEVWIYAAFQYFVRCKSFPRWRADIGKCER